MIYEIHEYFNPPLDAMCRLFACCICGKCHLHYGDLARVWVGDVIRTASRECADKAQA